MVRREREGIAVKKAETYFVVVTSEHDGLKKGGDPKNPSQGCYGRLGPGHIRHEGRDDAADELAKAIGYHQD